MAGDKPVSGNTDGSSAKRPGIRRSILPEDHRTAKPPEPSGAGENASQSRPDSSKISRDLRPGETRTSNGPDTEIASSPDATVRNSVLRLDQVPLASLNPSREWTPEKVDEAWNELIASRKQEPKLSQGAEIARKVGYPPAEQDYHWSTTTRDNPAYMRNGDRTGEPNPDPVRAFNPETRRFENVLSASEAADALGLPDAQPGYHWELSKKGILTYERDSTDSEKRVYDAATDMFVKKDTHVEPPLFASKKLFPLTSVNEASLQEMERLVGQRGEAKQRRNNLEINAAATSLSAATDKAVPVPASKELTAARHAVNEASRLLGERAAEAYMLKTYGDSPGVVKIYQVAEIGSADAPSRSGDFDQVWEVTNDASLPPQADASSWTLYREGTTLILIEAKGGRSPLGTRDVHTEDGNVRTCSQGTRPYLIDIADNMIAYGDGHTAAIGEAVLEALDKKQLRYVLVHAPIGRENGRDVLRDIMVKEFDIQSGYTA